MKTTVIDRETVAGRFTVVAECGELRASLAGKPANCCMLFKLARPVAVGDRLAVAAINNNLPVYGEELAAIDAACALYEERAALLSLSDYGEEFPGSRRYRAAQAAEAKLATFDQAHPEIKASLVAREAAAREARPSGWGM